MEAVSISFSVSSRFRQAREKEREVGEDYSWQDQFHSFSSSKWLCAWKLKCVCVCVNITADGKDRSQKVNLTSYYTLFLIVCILTMQSAVFTHSYIHTQKTEVWRIKSQEIEYIANKGRIKFSLLSDIFSLLRRMHHGQKLQTKLIAEFILKVLEAVDDIFICK